jgi:hypothetical protein
MASAAKTAVWVWRPKPGPFRKSKWTLVIVARLRPRLRRNPADSAVALEDRVKSEEVRGADAQH